MHGIWSMINGIILLVFYESEKSEPNMRGNFAHWAADTTGQFGVVVTGL